MKIITISKIGYNAPSQANWSYGIWKLDFINTDNVYNMSYTVKEQFGGDARIREQFPQILETKGVYTSTGTQKITGIAKLMDIESKEMADIIKEFLEIK